MITGGTEYFDELDTVLEFDPAANSFATRTKLTNARSSHASICVSGSVYVLCGFASGSALNSIECMEEGTTHWTDYGKTSGIYVHATDCHEAGDLFVTGLGASVIERITIATKISVTFAILGVAGSPLFTHKQLPTLLNDSGQLLFLEED